MLEYKVKNITKKTLKSIKYEIILKSYKNIISELSKTKSKFTFNMKNIYKITSC